MSLLDVAFKKPKPITTSEWNDITHQDLVDKAKQFISKICYVTLTEIKVQNQIESPDVIGFQSYKSIVIECKKSYQDFRQDKLKDHRANPAYGMGDTRFFFALSGVIPTSELPINWGLIEWYPEINQNCMKIVRPSGKFHPDKVREHMLLVTVIRRIGESNKDEKIVLKDTYKDFIDMSTLLNLEPIV